MIVARWTPTQAELDAFAALSGDANPIHVDPAYCATTRFGLPVCHGMLIHARLWAMAAGAFPGRRWREARMMFPEPARVGEALTLRLDPGPEGLAASARRDADGALCLDGLWVAR